MEKNLPQRFVAEFLTSSLWVEALSVGYFFELLSKLKPGFCWHASESELLPTHLAILLCRAGQGGSHAGKAQAGSRLKFAPDSLAEWSKALASGASP